MDLQSRSLDLLYKLYNLSIYIYIYVEGTFTYRMTGFGNFCMLTRDRCMLRSTGLAQFSTTTRAFLKFQPCLPTSETRLYQNPPANLQRCAAHMTFFLTACSFGALVCTLRFPKFCDATMFANKQARAVSEPTYRSSTVCTSHAVVLVLVPGSAPCAFLNFVKATMFTDMRAMDASEPTFAGPQRCAPRMQFVFD